MRAEKLIIASCLLVLTALVLFSWLEASSHSRVARMRAGQGAAAGSWQAEALVPATLSTISNVAEWADHLRFATSPIVFTNITEPVDLPATIEPTVIQGEPHFIGNPYDMFPGFYQHRHDLIDTHAQLELQIPRVQ